MDEEGSDSKIKIQRHVNLLMSGSFASLPSFSGSSCYSFDVGRNLIKEGKSTYPLLFSFCIVFSVMNSY